MPLRRRAREDLAPGLRMVPFEHSAVVLYLVDTGNVVITNIFRRRNYAALFNSSDSSHPIHFTQRP